MAHLPTHTVLYKPWDTLKFDNRFNKRLKALIKQNSIINEDSFQISVANDTVTIGKGICVVNNIVVQLEEVTVDLREEGVIVDQPDPLDPEATIPMDDTYIYLLVSYGYSRRMEINKAEILILKEEDVDFSKMDRYIFLGALAYTSDGETGTLSYYDSDTFFSGYANYIPISTLDELVLIGVDEDYPLNGNYVLVDDIDASPTREWNYYEGEYEYVNDYLGWKPIGLPDNYESYYVEDYGESLEEEELWANAFTGIFDGLGHTIYNLYSTYSSTGLFFSCIGATVRNLNIDNCNLSTRGTGFPVGAACGIARYSYFQNISVSGYNRGGRSGGIVGLFDFDKDEDATNEYFFLNCKNESYISSFRGSGGIVGYVRDRLSDYSSTGYYYLMKNCFSIGTITSSDSDKTSGLIGEILTGAVEYGFNEDSTIVVTHCYHNVDYETTLVDEGGDPDPEYYKTDTELITQTTFEEWDFSDIWSIDDGVDYPYLSWSTIIGTSKVYSESYYEFGNVNGGVVLIGDVWQDEWQ